MKNSDQAAFEQLLDIHGSNLERWPTSTRHIADTVLRESPEAQLSLREAHALDVLLDVVSVPHVAQRDLRTRILDLLSGPERDWFSRCLDWMSQGSWGLRPAAFAMVPLLIGLGVGLAATQSYEDDDLTDAFTLLAFEHIEDYDDAQ